MSSDSLLWDLYIGFPVNIDEETKQSVISVVNTYHPDCHLEAIVEGYWSGVEESTFQIQFTSTLQKARLTAKVIRTILEDGFVALCEAEN